MSKSYSSTKTRQLTSVAAKGFVSHSDRVSITEMFVASLDDNNRLSLNTRFKAVKT